MTFISGIIASLIQNVISSEVSSKSDYSVASYDMWSFSVPMGEVPDGWGASFFYPKDTASSSYELWSFSTPLNEIPDHWGTGYFYSTERSTTTYSLCSFSVPFSQLPGRLGYFYIYPEQDKTTSTYSLCSLSVPSSELPSNLGYFFLSSDDIGTSTYSLCSFSLSSSQIYNAYPLSSTLIVNATKSSIYGVSADAFTSFSLNSNNRTSFVFWEVTNPSKAFVPINSYRNSLNCWLSGGTYDASKVTLSARAVVGFGGKTYRSNAVELKPFSNISDIPNLQLWLDASDSNTLSGGVIAVPRGTFIDASSNKLAVSNAGNVVPSFFSPFSSNGRSAYFDGSSYLTTPSTVFPYTNSTWTVECWINFSDLASRNPIWSLDDVTQCVVTSTGLSFSWRIPGQWYSMAGAFSFQANVWYHIALSRSGTSWLLFIDGKPITITGGGPAADAQFGGMGRSDILYVGAIDDYPFGNSINGYCNGYISNFRITNTVVYPSAFTPSTIPLTNISGTTVLVDFASGVEIKGGIIDSSSNNFIVIKNGNVGQGNFSPFFTVGSTYNPDTHGGSVYFPGANGNYLSIPSNAAFNFSSGIFTVECWVLFNSVPSSGQSVIAMNYNSTTTGWYLQLHNSKIWVGFSGDGGDIIGTTTMQANTWYHIAVSGSAGSYKLFIDGIQEGATYTGATSLAGGTLGIGAFGDRFPGQYPLNGYVSSLRIVNGTALYTSNFSVPTAPLTTVTNTSLLLNFRNGLALDGTVNNSLIPYGNAAIINSSKKYGIGSFQFNGNGDYILAPSRPNYKFGSDNFTIECWVQFNNTTVDNDGIADTGSTLTTANGNQWYLYRINTNLHFGRHGGGGNLLSYGTSSLLPGIWYHIAVTRDSGNLSMFVDGVRVASINYTNWIIDDSNVRIGAIASPYYMKGNIDDFRLTRGVSRYGPSTVLLLNGNGSDDANNNTFLDSSSNKFTVTRTGNVTQGSFSPFPLNGASYNASVHGGSGYFDNSSITSTAAVNELKNVFNSSNYTIEGWIFVTEFPTTGSRLFLAICGPNQPYFEFFNLMLNSTGKMVAQKRHAQGASNESIKIFASTSTLSLNAWNHIAFVVSGDSASWYINGIRRGTNDTFNSPRYVTTNQQYFNIGGNWPNGYTEANAAFKGWISDVRINKTSLYINSTLTIPIAPLTSISNTSLLLNFTNGGVIDSTSKNNLVTFGNAKINTSVKKNGSGSIYFDGSGDFLTCLNDGKFNFGTGDFTVEAWVNFNTIGSSSQIICGAWWSTTNTGWHLYYRGLEQKITFYINNGVVIQSNVSLIAQQWHHIAVSRQASTLRLFVDGVGASVTNTTNITTTNPNIEIGYQSTGTTRAYLNGYIDDLRITKGAALYASDFTPPSSELSLTNLAVVSASPFTPPVEHSMSSFSDVSLLLQANEPGFEVFTWKDKSSKSNLAFQTKFTSSPFISSLGGGSLSAVVFNGTSHIVNLALPLSSITNSRNTQFVVYNRDEDGIVSKSLGNASTFDSTYLHWNNNRVYAFDKYSNPKFYPGRIVGGASTEDVLVMSVPEVCSLLTLQNNTLIDNGEYKQTLTGYNSIASSTVTINGGSTTAWTFDANTNKYITGQTRRENIYHDNPFTVEVWINPTAYTDASNYGSVIYGQTWNGSNYFILFLHPDGRIWFAINNTYYYSTKLISLNTWTHIAVVREDSNSPGNLKMYINGILERVDNISFYFESAGTVGIGTYGHSIGAQKFNGQMSNLRIMNGKALYQPTFSLPTVPLALGVANTSLQTLTRTSTLSDYSSNVLPVSGFGNLQSINPSTGFFSDWCWKFDGSSYIKVPHNSVLSLSSSNFTIEFYYYRDKEAASSGEAIYTKRFNTSQYGSMTFGAMGSKFYLYMSTTGSSWPIANTSISNVDVGKWQHIALVRNGNKLLFYKNGSCQYMTDITGTIYDSGAAVVIGADSEAATGYTNNAYISNLRVNKGSILYTTNFTVPTPSLTKPTKTSIIRKQNDFVSDWSETKNYTLNNLGTYREYKTKGAVNEIIFASCELPEAELTLVSNYLKTKWQI